MRVETSKKRLCIMTLGEMIAVMTIIIVLTTIFLPLVMKSREWGKSISCKGNMKNIYNAIIAYTADSAAYLPPSSPYPNGVSWTYRIQSAGYLAAPKKFVYTAGNASMIKSGVFLGYPADYSSSWACPSQEIAPLNRQVASIIYGNPNYSTNYTFKGTYWHSTHYALTGTINYAYSMPLSNFRAYYRMLHTFSRQTPGPAGLGFLMDSMGGPGADTSPYWNNLWNNTGGGVPCQFGNNLGWVRHWGTAYGLNSTNYLSSSYLEIGGGQLNTIFLDGHSESWSNKTWWNKYLSRGKSPFSLLPQ